MIVNAVRFTFEYLIRRVKTIHKRGFRLQNTNQPTNVMAANKTIKLLIDTDPGFDDAMAIAAALKWPNVEVLAIICVKGNVSCDQACKNALKIRKLFGGENVPVYKGAEKPIYSLDNYHASHWHGVDGLCDVADYITIDERQLEKQHGVNKMIDIVMENKGQVTLLAIGPLTNLALAIRLKPELPKFLKDLVILGGNYTGLGNHTRTAEFNFVADPLAANIVLEEYSCPKYIVPWETVLDSPFSSGFRDKYTSQDNERSKLFKLIIDAHCKKHDVDLTDSADTLAVCVALDKENVTAEQLHSHVSIEPFGHKTHGMMVVERRRNAHIKYDYHQPNAFIITKVNIERVEEILLNSVL